MAKFTGVFSRMIVEDQPAWAPRLRSRHRLRIAPKRHFLDPSLAVAALRATPERLLDDLELLGFLFKSLVVRDLRIYAQAADAHVLHYRDDGGLEVDAIVEAGDGRWMAFEVSSSKDRSMRPQRALRALPSGWTRRRAEARRYWA
jgi:predicted AAA+ superfamily ATPase